MPLGAIGGLGGGAQTDALRGVTSQLKRRAGIPTGIPALLDMIGGGGDGQRGMVGNVASIGGLGGGLMGGGGAFGISGLRTLLAKLSGQQQGPTSLADFLMGGGGNIGMLMPLLQQMMQMQGQQGRGTQTAPGVTPARAPVSRVPGGRQGGGGQVERGPRGRLT
jgi:hypothetical protein